MSEKNENVDQFGTYSKNVGEWTTGTSGNPVEPTHIHPDNAASSADDASDNTNDATSDGRRTMQQEDTVGASDKQI